MKIETFPDADAAAQKAAEIVAGEAWPAVKARGVFIVAVSGGHNSGATLIRLRCELRQCNSHETLYAHWDCHGSRWI